MKQNSIKKQNIKEGVLLLHKYFFLLFTRRTASKTIAMMIIINSEIRKVTMESEKFPSSAERKTQKKFILIHT